MSKKSVLKNSLVITFFVLAALHAKYLGVKPLGLTLGFIGASTGTIQAQLSVNQQGTPSYIVPIVSAPGVNGVHPQLSIGHTGGQADGLFGKGWSLSGISAITRCSIIREGNRYPVNYGKDDRFCFEGKYLLPVSGNYGEPGTIYHTEIESWVRFEAFYSDTKTGKSCGSGPCYFIATLKNGYQMKFATTTDSRIEAVAAKNSSNIPSGSVRVWSISRYSDLNGNYIDYSYNENTNTGEYVPTIISYGGNENSGVASQRAIEFTFADAASTKAIFQGGAIVTHSQKIKSIASCIAAVALQSCASSSPKGFTRVANYAFEIDFNEKSQLSYLRSIQLTGQDGSMFPPTTFSYSEIAQTQFQSPQNWTNFFATNPSWTQACQGRTMGDFNGDGRIDLIGFGSSNTEFALSQGLPISSPEITCLGGEKYNNGCSNPNSQYYSCKAGFGTSYNNPRSIGDTNGDGKYDVIGFGGSNISVSLSNGSGFGKQASWASNFLTSGGSGGGWSSFDVRTLADINGDGLADVIGFGNTTTQFAFSNGSTFTNKQVLQNFFSRDQGFSIKNGNPPMLGDVNGDGRIDVIGVKKENGVRKAYVGLSNGDNFQNKTVWNASLSLNGKPGSLIAGRNPIFLLDVNGDRLADLVLFGDDAVYVSLSSGTSFAELQAWNSQQFTYNNGDWNDSNQNGGTMRTFADVNGDGLPDLLGFGRKGVLFGINTGSSFVYDEKNFPTVSNGFNYNSLGYLQSNPRYPSDVTGDGVSDLLALGSQQVIVAVAPTNQSLLTKVTNGLGQVTEFCYQSISASAVDVVGQCSAEDKKTSVYSTLPTSEFNSSDLAWCKGRCREFNSPFFVVKSRTVRTQQNGGAAYRYEYKYAGAMVDKQSYGFLGFRRSVEIDLQANLGSKSPGLQHISYFRQAFPFKGELEKMQLVRVDGQKLLSQTDYIYQTVQPVTSKSSYQVLISNQTTTLYSSLSKNSYATVKNLKHDDYGNVTVVEHLGNTADPTDDLYTLTTYTNDASNWILGYPSDMKNCSTASCSKLLSHEQYGYDAKYNLSYKRSYDDVNSVWLGTEYTDYDPYGNVLQTNNASWDSKLQKQSYYNQIQQTYEATYNTYPATLTNALQQKSATTYDPSLGKLLTQTDINGTTVTMEYDGFGRIVTLYGPNPSGQKTLLNSYEYGEAGGEIYRKSNKLISWNGKTQEVTLFYDSLKRVYRQEEEATSGTISQLTCYQSLEQIHKSSLPYYKVADGNTCSKNNAAYWITNVYDALNRPKQITHADSSVTQISYDIQPLNKVNRNYTIRTDAFGKPEQRILKSYLDTQNHLLMRIFPQQNGVSTQQAVANSYDPLGRQIQTIAPGGTTTSYVYDTLGRITSVTNSDSGTVNNLYYPENGLLKSSSDANNSVHSIEKYDSLLRIAQESFANGQQKKSIQYTYDVTNSGGQKCYGIGHLSTVSDSQGITYNYCYDALGKKRYSKMSIDSKTFTIAADFDPLGRMTDLTYPDTSVSKRSYNTEGPLNQIQLCQAGGKSCESYAQWQNFSATGHPANMSYKNGVTTNFSYDAATGKLTSAVAAKASTKLLDKSYSWNALQLLTGLQDNLNSDLTMNVALDPAGSLKTVTLGVKKPLVRNYSYNVSGALTQKGDVALNSYSGQKLTSSSQNGVDTKYQYYNNALLKSKTTGNTMRQFTYNGQNRLNSVKTTTGSSSTSATFVYDYRGRVVKRTDSKGVISYYISKNYDITLRPSASNAVYTKTLHSLAHVVAAVSVGGAFANQTFPVPSSGSWYNLLSSLSFGVASKISQTNTIFTFLFSFAILFAFAICCNPFLWKSHPYLRKFGSLFNSVTFFLVIALVVQLLSPVALLAQSQGDGYPEAGNTLFFHTDNTGSTTLVTGTNGTVRTQLTYLPFGEIYQSLSTGPDDFRAKFDGSEFNSDIGLYKMGARFYDPLTGQFIQADNRVLGGPSVLATSYNRFAFSGNNPITYSDPSGHSFGGFIKNLAVGLAISAAIVAGAALLPGVGVIGGVGLVGAYWGAESANDNLNPLKWDWKSGKTYGALAAGFAVAEVGLALTIVAPELLPEEAGAFATFMAGLGAASVDGFSQNATFAALGGANSRQAFMAGLEGAAIGATFHTAFSAAGAGVGAATSRFSRTAAAEGEEASSFGRESVGEESSDGIGLDSTCSSSFAAGTMVQTQKSLKPIEQIRLGDKVLATDEKTGKTGYYPVVAEFSRLAADAVLVITDDQLLETTAKHPFYVRGKGWVKATDLQSGDELITRTGNSLVASVRARTEKVKVYNIEVGQAHTYYIAEDGFWNHNPTCQLIGHNWDPITRKRTVIAHFWEDLPHTGSQPNDATRYAVNGGVWSAEPKSVTYTYVDASGNTVYSYTAIFGQGPGKISSKGTWGYDAGHIFPQQLGGSGTDLNNIFAQNPQHNRGNAGYFNDWRKFENRIRAELKSNKQLRGTATFQY